MLLLDTTGSMNAYASPRGEIPRERVVKESIRNLLRDLGGSVRTVTFAGGKANDIGDLRVDTIAQQWNNIVWDGNTLIMPGVSLIYQIYEREFKMAPDGKEQKLLILIITDGEAEDLSKFETMLAGVQGMVYVELAVIGYGIDHDDAFKSFCTIAEKNRHVRVTPFDSKTNPDEIAASLYKMIN